MKKGAVKFIAVFLCVCLAVTGLMSAAVWCFDPQNVFRWNDDGVRYFNPTYSAAGSLTNYDYDLALIGSSLVQNYDAAEIADLLDCRPLKLTLGAITPGEVLYLYDRVQETHKTKRYIINLDLHRISMSEAVPNAGRFPEYMFKSDVLSRMKYFLGFETWFRFMPVDLALSAAKKMNISLPASFQNAAASATDINTASAWYSSPPPGAETVLNDFLRGKRGFNEGDTILQGFIENPVENFNAFLEHILLSLDSDETILFILPPCSVLYWADKTDEQFESMLEMRQLAAELCAEHDNLTVLDFQSEAFIADLDNYYDASHFSLEIQELMAHSLATDEYRATPERMQENSEKLREITAQFKAQYLS